MHRHVREFVGQFHLQLVQLADTWMGTNTGNNLLSVGIIKTLQGTIGKDHVIAVADFSNGSDQVIYDNTI